MKMLVSFLLGSILFAFAIFSPEPVQSDSLDIPETLSYEQPSIPVLTIDPEKELSAISPMLYGVNIANWAPWYYMKMLGGRLRDARVEVVRLGATNMERYDYKTNRMYNVISFQNEFVPLSWESFVDWVIHDVGAKPFLQASVYGNIPGPGQTVDAPDYSVVQEAEDVTSWVASSGASVPFWGIGNEPWIAWKRFDYPDAYQDAAHGDQVLNAHTSYAHYFNRFITVAGAVKQGNSDVKIFGPTPANWWLYWNNEYSPLCPVTEPNGPALTDSQAWTAMLDPASIFDPDVFPDRGGDPEIAGWETDPEKTTGQYLIRMQSHEKASGRRIADYLDLHRYIRCITDADAIQEPRGLFQEDFRSWDMETLYSGVKTNLLNRMTSAIETYYPGTRLSFSEYGYFYWEGFPSIAQITAVGTMDYLGFFARGGVELACSWYLGEPNQSGENSARASDSRKQAMFGENGDPNPKYWAFYLMSTLFRGRVVSAESSDWDRFTVHACKNDNGDVVVIAAYKGQYDPSTGEFIPQQPPVRTMLKGVPEEGYGLKSVYRYGQDDPFPISLDIQGMQPVDGVLTMDFYPLAIYAFVFSKEITPPLEMPAAIITPETIALGPYATGTGVEGTSSDQNQPHLKITNTGQAPLAWSISESSDWLNLEDDAYGSAAVTDRVNFRVDRQGLDYGTYETQVFVTAGGETYPVTVRMDVIPGEEGGEKRFADFETGSLAHTWAASPPYAVGWWNGQGSNEDRNRPYIYEFSLDSAEVNRLGNEACLRVDFNRAYGDTDNGRRYQGFGTYGHSVTVPLDEDGSEQVKNASGDWQGFDAFSFDIKTETNGENGTELLVVLTDASGNKWKSSWGINDHAELPVIQDGIWQTVILPLDGSFFDWQYPGGQDGSLITLDWSAIVQIEFVPWANDPSRKGTVWLDNLRVIGTDSSGNRLPVARVRQAVVSTEPGAPLHLDASPSFDPDGDSISFSWSPHEHLSDPQIQDPVFSSDEEGNFIYDLTVTDRKGKSSRNIQQLVVSVTQSMPSDDIISIGGGASGQGCFLRSVITSTHDTDGSKRILYVRIFILFLMFLYLCIEKTVSKQRFNKHH